MTVYGTGSQQDAPPAPGAGLTVREALELPCLSGARLVAGARGDGRRIRVVNIMEVPDIVRWMRGGELLLTTAYAVRDDVDALCALVPVLAERGLAGLGVKVGPYLSRLPPRMLRLADELGFPVVELPGGVMFNDILSEVIGTVLNRQALELEHSRAIHERLTRVAIGGGSYQDLMNVLLELSGCAAAVLDEHGAVLASAGAPPTDEPPAHSRTVHVDSRAAGSVGLWTATDPDDDTGLQGHAHRIVALEHATTVAATIAAQERAVTSREQRYRALMLMELVSRPPRDRAETVRRASAMGWNPWLPRAAVLLEVTDAQGASPCSELALEERLLPLARRAAGDDAVIWSCQGGLAMLVAAGDALTDRCHAVHRAVTAAHPDWDVVVAAGTVRDDFADFHHSYAEAVETLTLGREVHGPDFVRGYAELGVYRLLGHLPDEELRRLVADALGPLLDYDRDHEGSLVDTLGAYLLHDRNGVAVAARLHIHYNTLRYRLRQIERLTGGLERTPMSRLQTELAVHARRMLTARDRG
ncbi:PucR family transcriptional regulator [Streptomyces longispororuber]|uniref:PucR family transcriptional regulator n=1 Tax=Streptomyces longispororuber TaxID=68230 RepID=UPI002109C107|nr:PucR family transcriptional regulator [Streptomyces longispororuber]MCQ4207440.1 PucR family transcriptional regulator ligand-binding domain-containing protein [Streptomyces longispororuber]